MNTKKAGSKSIGRGSRVAKGGVVRRTPAKAIGPKIDESKALFYEEMFKSINAGTKCIIESFPGLYKQALLEIRNVFSSNELKAVFETINGKDVLSNVIGSVGRFILFQAHEHIRQEKLDKKFEIDAKELLSKFEKMTDFQRVALILWCYPSLEERGLTIDRYIVELLEES